MARNKSKIHSDQERLYQYHQSNQEIISKHSIKELKALDLEYRKQERSSKILSTGKKDEKLKNAKILYRMYQRNDIKIKQTMKYINISTSFDFSKQIEQKVTIDKVVRQEQKQ
jgi:hypothetical protein